MLQEFKIYSGGQFRKGFKPLVVKSPFDGRPVATTWLAGPEELEFSIRKALDIREELEDFPAFRKYKALREVAGLLEKDKHECATLLCLESAKPIRYALAEVERAIQTFLVASEECKRLPGEYLSLDWTAAGSGKEGIVRYFTVGLVAGISPFNFPLNLAVHKIAPAIAAGCPIVLKPSSTTPLSTLKLARMIDKTGLPKGSVSILPMDRETGNRLVTDERFSLLSFTGSPEVGWKMKKEAGKKKTILELGGNAGVIVTESANIEVAVQKCLVGGFAYSGQVCIHAQRIYIHESVFDEFTFHFIEGAANLRAGNPLEPETEISSMIDEANAIRIEEWIREAVRQGARILCGGNRQGSYYPPTILSGTDNTMKVCACEVFGPVVTVEPYQDFEQALHRVNDSRFGLQAGVFTNRIDEMNRAFVQLQVGGVIINDVPTFRVDHMPYGGIKDSGQGREGVQYAIREMLEPKILVKDRS